MKDLKGGLSRWKPKSSEYNPLKHGGSSTSTTCTYHCNVFVSIICLFINLPQPLQYPGTPGICLYCSALILRKRPQLLYKHDKTFSAFIIHQHQHLLTGYTRTPDVHWMEPHHVVTEPTLHHGSIMVQMSTGRVSKASSVRHIYSIS